MNTYTSVEIRLKEIEGLLIRCQTENKKLYQKIQVLENIQDTNNLYDNQIISKQLQLQIEQQTFISKILRLLQTTDNISASINQIIELLGKQVEASTITIFENSKDGKYISNTFEWCSDGVESRINQFQNIAYNDFPVSKRSFDTHRMICANSLNDLPVEMRNIFSQYGHDIAILFLDMEHSGEKIGFINVNRYTGKSWTENITTFIQQVADVIATAILRNRTEKELVNSIERLKMNEEELNSYKNNLEFLVNERTDELAVVNQELILTNEELYASNDELSELNEQLAEEVRQKDLTQMQLKESENKLRSFIEQIDEGIAIFDNDGIVTEWNQFMENITNITTSQAVGLSHHDLKELIVFDDTDINKIVTDYFPLKGRTFKINVTLKINEEQKFCILHFFPVLLINDSLIGVGLMDITEQRRNEMELEQYRNHLEDEIKSRTRKLYESELRIRSLSDNLSDGAIFRFIQTDQELIKLEYASARAETMFGVSINDCMDDLSKVFINIHPDDILLMKEKLNSSSNEHFELRFTIDGELKWYDFSFSAYSDAKNRRVFDGIVMDITERKVAEQKVQASLEQQQLMSQILQELHYNSNLDESLENILSWIGEYTRFCSIILREWTSGTENQHCIKWGSEPTDSIQLPDKVYVRWAEYIRKDLALIYDYTHLPNFVKPYFRKESVNRIYAFPFSQQNKTCGIMILTQQIKNSKIDDWGYNEISFMQSVAQIISNALEKHAAQNDLIKAKEHAEEADKLKSAFLANMSHEIRTPMNGVVGFASLIEKEMTSPRLSQYAQIINDNCHVLLQLLDDIIDISKLESNQLKMKPINCDLNHFLSDLLLLYRQVLKKKGKEKVEIILDQAQSDEFIMVDTVRLQQVLTNLISNAIKFTDKGFINWGYYKTDDYLLFYVKDSGTGIPQNHLNIIFERFRQVEDNNDRNKNGTGLGLAISKSLVEMMGGKIWVESEVGSGSNFYFTIKHIPITE